MDELLSLYRVVTGAGVGESVSLPTLAGRSELPLRPMAEVQGGDAPHDKSRPVICRGFNSLPEDPKLFEELLRAEPGVFGYSRSAVENEDDGGSIVIKGAEAWAQFQARALKINILDSGCWATERLLADWRAAAWPRPKFVCWVLTVAPKLTYFHIDTFYGGCFMHLCSGRKTWLFIPPDAMATIEQRHGFKTVNVLPLADLLKLDDGFLWGKILIGELRAGDLLYFPDGWAHYVRTTEDCTGYGGYFGSAPASPLK